MVNPSFEAITGRLGVGAILMLALFMIVDGLNIGAYQIIETYGDSVAWGLVGVLPTLVVTYILGVLCVGSAEIAYSRVKRLNHAEDVASLVTVSQSDSDLIQQAYLDLLRRRELLEGASIAFLFLGFGSLSELASMRGSEMLVYGALAGSVGLALASFVFAVRAAAKARALVESVA